MPHLFTTLGPRTTDTLGLILPHEHIFGNFDGFDHAAAESVTAAELLAFIGPEIEHAELAGVTALAEATSIGGARRVDLVKAVSETTGLPVLAATGIFREPWISEQVRMLGEAGLRDWMIRELNDGIDDTGVRAGWIKLRSGDDGLSPEQATLIRAAASAGRASGAAIGSHTVRGRVAQEQAVLLDRAGYSAARFIWVHAQVEPDAEWNLRLARQGAWIEYDGIGEADNDALYVDRIRLLWDAGFGAQILLSQDRGWYDPLKPGGGTPKPYTYLVDSFLPKLSAAGFDEVAIRQMTHLNPFNAYAR